MLYKLTFNCRFRIILVGLPVIEMQRIERIASMNEIYGPILLLLCQNRIGFHHFILLTL